MAPPLRPVEVTNIIRQHMHREALPRAEARQRLAVFLAMPVDLRVPDTPYRRGLEIEEHGLAAAYDAHYVALAALLGCVHWTHDQRLLRALGGKLSFVRPIAGYRTA